ncbi:HNH endonuclease [Paracoccus alcaliphilus]|uniref:Putative HNH nuclease YajD n=2 Tax=Paracoccus alcaliphilus TaxID=34002 RepID=A0A1H8KBX8_9RHOB|nr:HNH endonuclease [Paracoccus alcaliphilus]WCR17083.1 HNH endonuclease [Paracoccus alcaliphilus]SEN90473.1 HNH endonuclease [Paracoccus alcaliphilus]
MSRLGRMPSRFDGAEQAGQRLSKTFRDRFQHREVIEPWRRWYKTARWQRLREGVLIRDLFTCKKCGKIESDTSQLVGDHIVAHRGNADLFWLPSNIQCLCKPCHDRIKQAEERSGHHAS